MRTPTQRVSRPPDSGLASAAKRSRPRIQRANADSHTRHPAATHHHTDKPNKKYYDPRVWQRAGQMGMIARLEQAFAELNAVNSL